MEMRLLVGGELVAGPEPPLDVDNPTTGEVLAQSREPGLSRSTPRSPRPARRSARGAMTPAAERAEALHGSPRGCASTPRSSRGR